jgi:predicted RNase H-like HicB family nuclease
VNRYAIIVFWSEEDGSWVADVLDLKSCSAFGGTPEEALAEVQVE